MDLQKKSLRAIEQDRDDVQQLRKNWCRRLSRRNRERLIYLDESGAKTNMTRRYGRALRGERVVDTVPAGKWTTLTVVAGILIDRVVAPMITNGPMNGLVFSGYIEHFLAPELQPGDTVIMDNLACHHSNRVVEMIEDRGAKPIYLPPYSPDLNPIEKMWSKVKTHLRAVAKRTIRTLINATGEALKTITTEDCRGYFRSVGIESPD